MRRATTTVVPKGRIWAGLVLGLALSACDGGEATTADTDSEDTDDTEDTVDTEDSEDTDDTDPVSTATWSEAFDTSATGALSGVWGSAPDDVWIVGGSDAGGEAYHFDGTDWSSVAVPKSAGLLVWAYGFASDDVLTVGENGTMLHWDGTTWTTIDTGTTEDLWGIWASGPDDVWIVGGTPDVGGTCGSKTKTCMWHYDGTTFEAAPISAKENARAATSLFKVWGIGDEVFAVGQRGLVLRKNGAGFEAVSAGAEANQDFVSLWGTSDDHIVVAGGRSNAKVAFWDGSTLETLTPSGFGGLSASWMGDPAMAHVGGASGFVGTVDMTSQELVWENSLGTMDVHAMWGDGAGRVYAVAGRFLSPYAGEAWVREETK